jgi:hypothetical protein
MSRHELELDRSVMHLAAAISRGAADHTGNGGSVRVLPDPRITQGDGTTGRGAPGSRTLLYPRRPGTAPAGSTATFTGARPYPGLLDDPGLASAFQPRIARGPQAPVRQPGHPGARSSGPAVSGRPGRAPVHPLRRDPRPVPPPGGTASVRQARRRRRQRTTAIREDPVGGMSGQSARFFRWQTTGLRFNQGTGTG